jgi:alpha-galactosidase
VRDLWQHKDAGRFSGKFSAPVVSHGVVMVTIKP